MQAAVILYDSRKGGKSDFVVKITTLRRGLVRRGDPQRFHLAVEVAALEAEGAGCLRHIPTMLLQFAKDELAFVGAASFVER